MRGKRNVLIGATFLLAMGIPVLMATRSGPPGASPEVPGPRGYLAPHEIPFPGAERTSLSEAEALSPFPITRPNHPLATDAGIVAVWVQHPGTDTDDAAVQVALWYDSGLEIHVTPVSPGDDEPLISDFPDDLPVTYETIGTTDVRVIPPGVLSADQPGSVALVRDGVFITIFGWSPDVTASDLCEVAATLVAAPSA